MRLIERPRLMGRLEAGRGTSDIKVVTGLRRSGKSVLLSQFKDRVLREDPDANVISLDYNLVSAEPYLEYHALNAFVEDRYVAGAENVVIIDEVQRCEGFEKALNSLHATGRYDIYVTGSNSSLMAGDLATLLTGRCFTVDVFPFSLAEYMAYKGVSDPQEGLDGYLLEGGMPEALQYRNRDAWRNKVEDVYSALLRRDIREKYGVRRMDRLEALVDYLLENVGNPTSVLNIANVLSTQGGAVSDKTVAAYISHLTDAYMFYPVSTAGRGKDQLRPKTKYYPVDQSLRYARLGELSLDSGRVLEGIVAIELMRRGWNVRVGGGRLEVDFVAERAGERRYIQVSEDVTSPETFKRETGALLSDMADAYPRVLLARTYKPAYDYKGIRVLDLAEWLSGRAGLCPGEGDGGSAPSLYRRRAVGGLAVGTEVGAPESYWSL